MKKINQISSKSLTIILVVVACLFAYLWISKPTSVLLPQDTRVEDSLIRLHNQNIKQIQQDSILIVRLLSQRDSITGRFIELESLAEQMKLEGIQDVQVVTEQTIQEDTAYLAAYTNTPVEIIQKDHSEVVQITPMQLKSINQVIALNTSLISELEVKNSLINELKSIVNKDEQIIEMQKQAIQLHINDKNVLAQTTKAIQVQHVNELKANKKKDRKKGNRKMGIGIGIGAMAMALMIGLMN